MDGRMTDSTPPPAGWYPDPDDAARQRYWDGQEWAAPAAEPTPVAPVAEKPRTLWKAYLWWFPLGVFGAHHFYMGRKVWAWITAVTLNLLFIGWVLDGLMMPYWFSHMEKERIAREEMKIASDEMKEAGRQLRAASAEAGRELRAISAEAGKVLGPAAREAAKNIGPATVAASSWISQAIRLGGLTLSRDKTELSYGAQVIPASMARVSVMSGTASSRMSGSNVVGGAVFGGMLGHAGAGAVVGASARTNTTRVYIVVDFPGGQWVTDTSYKNERYARRFAAKVNSL